MSSSVHINYPELWASIQEGLNAWDRTWPAKIEALDQLSRVRDRRCGKTFSDEEIFEGIVKAVLSNATDWSGIQQILPELRLRFGGFDIAWYSHLTKTHIANNLVPWFRSHGAGAQYLERNLNFLVSTASKLTDRKTQYGNLENYLSGLLRSLGGDAIKLAKALGASSTHKLDGLGIPIAAEALKNIGYDVGKPDRHINRAFGCFGLQAFCNWQDRSGTKAPTATRTELLSVMDTLGEFADNLKVEATLVDNAIWLLCAYSGAYLSNEKLSLIRIYHEEHSSRPIDKPLLSSAVATEHPSRRSDSKLAHQFNSEKEVTMTNHDMIASAMKEHRGKILETSEIKKIVLKSFPNFAMGSLLPNDHAMGNKSDCSCAGTERRIFDRIEPKKYLVR